MMAPAAGLAVRDRPTDGRGSTMPTQPFEVENEYFPDEAYHLADEEAFEYDWDETGDYNMPEDETPWPEEETEPTFAAYDEG